MIDNKPCVPNKDPIKPLSSEKPEKVKPFSEQICLRCGKRTAEGGTVYCSGCHEDLNNYNRRHRYDEDSDYVEEDNEDEEESE